MTNTLTPDDYPDPVDRARGIDLASAGLPGYCATVAIGAIAIIDFRCAPT